MAYYAVVVAAFLLTMSSGVPYVVTINQYICISKLICREGRYPWRCYCSRQLSTAEDIATLCYFEDAILLMVGGL